MRRGRVGFVVVAVFLVSALPATIGRAVPDVEAIPFMRIKAVDATGRFALLVDGARQFPDDLSGLPSEVRFDRLTGAQVATPGTIVTSGDLRWAVVFGNPPLSKQPRWRNLDTGEQHDVATVVAGERTTAIDLSFDGQVLLAGLPAEPGAFVVLRSGEVEPVPVQMASPVDLSANGRWVLVRTTCLPSLALECARYYRVDRATGAVTLLSNGGTRFAFAIGDDGRIIETEWLQGNPFVGGVARVVARRVSGPAVELGWIAEMADIENSADGSLLSFVDASNHVVTVDTGTGARSVDPTIVQGWNASQALGTAVGATGSVVLAVRPGFPTTTDQLVAVTPVGRSIPPRLAAGEEFSVRVAGVGGVPEGVSAVALNVTVTNSGGSGYVTVWPCDEERPVASNVNFIGSGRTVANAVVATVAVSGSLAGSVCLFGSAAVDVVVDVQGYFTGGGYVGMVPVRTLDTRD